MEVSGSTRIMHFSIVLAILFSLPLTIMTDVRYSVEASMDHRAGGGHVVGKGDGFRRGGGSADGFDGFGGGE